MVCSDDSMVWSDLSTIVWSDLECAPQGGPLSAPARRAGTISRSGSGRDHFSAGGRDHFPVGIIYRPAGSSAVTQQAPPGPARPPRMAPAAAGCGAGAAALARSSAWDCRCAEIKSPSSLRLPKLEGAGRVVASDSDLKRHVARRDRRPPAQAGGRQPVTRHCVEIEFESGHGDYH